MKTKLAIAMTLIGFASSNDVSAQFAPLAPLKTAANSTTDNFGRVKYLIDISRDAIDGFPDIAPPEVSRRFGSRHLDKAKNMARALELQYGLTVVDMTSWVGNSITAYLTVDEMERVRRDRRITLITENSPTSNWFSGPPWSDDSPVSPPNPAAYGMVPYGHAAMNGLFFT